MAGNSARLRSDRPIAQPGPSRAFLTSLHPGGDAAAIRSIDELLEPAATADVVLLSMTPKQCRDGAGRQRLIERAVSALSPDGIIWVDVPGRWRSALMSALRGRGMATGAPTVRRARGLGGAEFVLTPRALRFALRRGHLMGRWRLVLAVFERMPFGRALLTRLLPRAGFAAFPPGATPFAWLVDRLTAEPAEVDVAVITNWRGDQAPFLVFAVAADEVLVAKRAGAECQAQVTHETAMLKLLGPGVANCGLEVPRLIGGQITRTLSTLIESDVPGRPMASLIREGHYRDLGRIADRLAQWLTRWNGKTLRHVELTSELAERLVLSAARPLAGSIDRGSTYLDWLSRETGRLVGAKVPLVAAHNDLTMANVLGDASGIRSVVDWEAASPDGLPLTDFRYAACDAAATIGGGDRLAAFRACFVEDGESRRRLQQYEAPLRAIAGGPPQWLELCIHAGWLRHAANEQARSSSRLDGAFIAIASFLAESVLSN
jgi:hypothetical protein